MNCPSCKKEGAYVGIIFAECPHVGCKLYTDKQFLERAATELSREVKSDPDLTPITGWTLPTDIF
jgi:hypothetical protein